MQVELKTKLLQKKMYNNNINFLVFEVTKNVLLKTKLVWKIISNIKFILEV